MFNNHLLVPEGLGCDGCHGNVRVKIKSHQQRGLTFIRQHQHLHHAIRTWSDWLLVSPVGLSEGVGLIQALWGPPAGPPPPRMVQPLNLLHRFCSDLQEEETLTKV